MVATGVAAEAAADLQKHIIAKPLRLAGCAGGRAADFQDCRRKTQPSVLIGVVIVI